MDVAVQTSDNGRQIDGVAYGLTALLLCVGPPRSRALSTSRVVQSTGTELTQQLAGKGSDARGDLAHLVLLRCEVGGRWVDEMWEPIVGPGCSGMREVA